MEDLPGTRLLFDDEGTPFPEPKKKVRKQTKSDMTFEQALKLCKQLIHYQLE